MCHRPVAVGGRQARLRRDHVGIVAAFKELPAAHRVLEGRAVVLEAVERRRSSPTRWIKEMAVEIGKDSERFTTAGDYYLFIEHLTRRGHQLSRSNRLWSIWVGDSPRYGKDATFGHIDPCYLRPPAGTFAHVPGLGPSACGTRGDRRVRTEPADLRQRRARASKAACGNVSRPSSPANSALNRSK